MITDAEQKFIYQQWGMNGGFYTKLIEAIMVSDTENRIRLRRGFPELVDVIDDFQHKEGYWEQLQERWNAENPKGKQFIISS